MSHRFPHTHLSKDGNAYCFIYSISTGMSGPLSFGLGLRDSALIIIFFGLLTAVFAPYFSRWGPILGLRQMVHARYSFGLAPHLLNLRGKP